MVSKLEARFSKHDRQIAAIRKLILQGMKMIDRRDKQSERESNRIHGEMDEIRKDIRELTTSQRETDRMLKTLIRSLERGRNGHPK